MKTRQNIERLWAMNKYRVMWHSQKHYNEIRKMIRNQPTEDELLEKINEALSITPTTGSMVNTFDHMWGYFKKGATVEEKERFLDLKSQLHLNDISPEICLIFIQSLSEKYEVEYLSNSTIIQQAHEY